MEFTTSMIWNSSLLTHATGYDGMTHHHSLMTHFLLSYDWGEMIDTSAVEENTPILSFRHLLSIYTRLCTRLCTRLLYEDIDSWKILKVWVKTEITRCWTWNNKDFIFGIQNATHWYMTHQYDSLWLIFSGPKIQRQQARSVSYLFVLRRDRKWVFGNRKWGQSNLHFSSRQRNADFKAIRT